MPRPVRLACLEDHKELLLEMLVEHRLDAVLTDTPASRDRVYSHLLGSSNIMLFAAPDMARMLRRRFPRSIENAKVLVAAPGSAMRTSVDHWFAAHQIVPHVVGEFQDSALMKVFGQQGAGVVAAPSVLRAELKKQYGLSVVGELEGIHEHYYAITAERRIKHPAVMVITDEARRRWSS
jgi:LysR family transcriptional activator of nhaA